MRNVRVYERGTERNFVLYSYQDLVQNKDGIWEVVSSEEYERRKRELPPPPPEHHTYPHEVPRKITSKDPGSPFVEVRSNSPAIIGAFYAFCGAVIVFLTISILRCQK